MIVDFTLNPTNICLLSSPVMGTIRLHFQVKDSDCYGCDGNTTPWTRSPGCFVRPSPFKAALGRCSICVEFERQTQVKDQKKKKSNQRNIVSGLHAASCFLFPGASMISNVTNQEKTERQTLLMAARRSRTNAIRVKSVLKSLRLSSDDRFPNVLMNQNEASSPRVRLKISPQSISKNDMKG